MPRGKSAFLSIALLVAMTGHADELPDGYWPTEQSQPILDTTLRITLDPDLSNLTRNEMAAAGELLAAGAIVHELYLAQRHAQAKAAAGDLLELHRKSGGSQATQNLLDLFYVSKGPIVTTLTNERQPFLPVRPETAGKNVYPEDLGRAELDTWLAENADLAAGILDPRSVVRRATARNRDADLEKLADHPALGVLHTGLHEQLLQVQESDGLYAVPYALAYAEELAAVRSHLLNAAEFARADSPDFAAYLENRSRDFLTGNYESGDASWVTGDFAGLNMQIGSYETYDDNLKGVKAFYGASLLVRDTDRTRELEAAIGELQAIQDSLPYAGTKRVQSRIPVGVYNVLADFGQSRGSNTATILPNDASHSRKYGRTILMRRNILEDDALFANRKLKYDAVVSERDRDDLTAAGGFNRTLWHEVGHYLGPSRTADGLELDAALADTADLFEELKSDLVSLFAAPALRRSGFHDDSALRAHYADGIRRTLQDVKPRRAQAYQTMQLMQFNYFLEHGLIAPEPGTGALLIDYERYHEVISGMLADVLEIQFDGNYEAGLDYIDRWDDWEERLHGVIAGRLRDAGGFRRTLVRYEAISSATPAPCRTTQ